MAISLVAILGAASLYAAGVIRVRRSSGRWPAQRTAAFASGLLALTAALVGPVDSGADRSFTVHMTQHIVLTLLAPPLLALGAPIALTLRAGSARTGRAVSRALRTPLAAFLANPIVGWTLFIGVPVFVHASRLFDLALRSTPWHAFEHGLWVGAALVYWWPIVGVDPSPHPVRYPVRLLSLFLAMPAMSFLALAIYSASAPLYATYAAVGNPFGWGALDEQQNAAVVMWLVGNVGLVVAMLLVAAAWKRDEDAAQRRLEAREDERASAVAAG